MIDHVGITATDHDASLAFYSAALAPLGVKPMMSFGDKGNKTTGLGDDSPFFWISDGGALTGGKLHLCFSAKTRADVDAFYAAAMSAGATDNSAPGLRPHYHETYYGAFVLDPDGHNIEAVCHAPG